MHSGYEYSTTTVETERQRVLCRGTGEIKNRVRRNPAVSGDWRATVHFVDGRTLSVFRVWH